MEPSKIGDIKSVAFKDIAMLPQLHLLPGAISEMIACVSDTGVLTVADRYGLMAGILDESLEEEDRRTIDRLLRSVLKGRTKIVNQLSMVS